jgi:ankyrin repeat protein
VAKLLAQHRGELSLTNIELAVFLNKIVMNGDLQMLQLSLLSGASVNCADYDERTPLHVAGDLGFQAIYDYLLLKGANPLKKDIFGNVAGLK